MEKPKENIPPKKTTSPKCRFFHDWGEWEVITEGNLLRSSNDDVIGYTINQKRACNKCKYIQLTSQNENLR